MRYLDGPKRQLFRQFKADHPEVKMCKSTFYNSIPAFYKKPCKCTDLCNICEDGKRNETALRKMEQQLIGSKASDAQRDALRRCRKRVNFFRAHKLLVNDQRESYNSEVSIARSHGCA